MVVDLFGDIDTDGTGEPWEYLDGWASRDPAAGPSPTFTLSDWSFSGPNALDGETTNATATNPFPSPSLVAPLQPLISEFEPNPNSNDPANVTIELSGEPGADFAGWFLSIEADSGAGAIIDRATEVSGTFDANGLLTVEFADLENPSFTVILTDSFTGSTGNTFSDTLIGTVFDAIGVPDSAADEANLIAASLGGTNFTFTGDEPRLIFRDGSRGDLFAVNDPDNGEIYDTNGNVFAPEDFDTDPTADLDTFDAVNPVFTGDAPVDTPDVAFNEFRISSPGSTDDTSNFVELFASPGASFNSLTLLVISGEFNPGSVDFVIPLEGAVADENGFLLVANSANPDLDAGDVSIDGLDFFGSPVTFLVVDGFTGAQGDDLDPDDTGAIANEPWTSIAASLGAVDGDDNVDQTYGAEDVIPADGGFPPAGAARDKDGTGAFVTRDFSDQSADTPGATNSVDNDGGDGGTVTIMEIQGAAHTSPLLDQAVSTSGIVTAVDSNGFYMQDPDGDGDIATSDGIFVFTGSAPAVAIGDAVDVSGTVSEFTPGGTGTGNLSITQISGSPTVNVTSSGNALPAATVLGAAGRQLPSETIDDDAFDSFDPTTDGIDFWESIEGMYVVADDPIAVSGTSRFGEVFVAVDGGANVTGLSDRGTLNISPDDFNPEKVQIDWDFGIDPVQVSVGAAFDDIFGVVSYSFGNYEIAPTSQVVTIADSPLMPEVTSIEAAEDLLTIASYNVLNLETEDGDSDADVGDGRFDAIATQIVDNLNAPDIIGLQEIQDNNGTLGGTGTGVVAADETLQALVDAIAAAGGPTYSFVDNTFIGEDLSGGFPGGNIRTAFLYNDDRVDLVDGSVQTISGQGAGEAFEGARLPLVADFAFNGEAVTVVNNRFSSKGGSAPIMGVEQPFEARQEDVTVNGSLDERQLQSAAVAGFVAGELTTDADANVVVLGDFNEFEFVSPITGLEAAGLTNLTNTLAENERYTFNFQGNSQSLDHILLSDALLDGSSFDIVHVN